MGGVEAIVKAPHKPSSCRCHLVGKYSKQLVVKKFPLKAKMIVKSCLGSPANMQCAVYICLGILHQFNKFMPIVNLLIGKVLHRSPCYYHSIKVTVLYLIECLVECVQVILLCVLRLM